MELTELKTNQHYFDNRYDDFYVITKISGKSLDNCFLTLKYYKGREKLESARFVLFCIDQKQHSLKSF